MTSYECSICFDEINASTGIATLSCGHSFHLNCIAKWFLNCDSTTSSTCAMCRKKMSDTEDFTKYIAEKTLLDGEDDSEDEDTVYESENTAPNEEIANRVLLLKQRLSSMDSEDAKMFAATKIQSVWRMSVIKTQMDDVLVCEVWEKRCEDRLKQAKIEYKITKNILFYGIHPWKKMVATHIQAIWRGYRVRRKAVTL